MSSVEQLRFVEAYWSQPHFSGKLGTIEGLYSAVLSGQAVPNANDTLPNFVQGHRNYAANSGLDFNRDGRVSSGEAASAITSRLYGGVRAVQSQLVDVGAVPANQVAGFVDGRFGPQTSAALARFQATQELPTTGLLDGATGIALFNNSVAAPSVPPTTSANGVPDLQLSEVIHERATPARQLIDSPVIGEFILTEGFMARGGPHSSKRATTAIFADNPTVAEPIAAGVYNLGIDYVTTNGRIQTWFDGQVTAVENRTTGYGNRLIMQTDVTFNYQGTDYPVFAHYAHADSFNVTTGDRIVAGQDIGDQGSTGHSTGDHVDFLTWIEVNNQRVYISPNLLAGNQS
jgi:murein DD-endopeptidase MepM/ murein hydrolase activator NlpD